MVNVNGGHASFNSVPLTLSDLHHLCCEINSCLCKNYLGTNYTEINQQQHLFRSTQITASARMITGNSVVEDDYLPTMPHVFSLSVGTGRCLRLRLLLVVGGVPKLLGVYFQ
jgi:hypothetical protein